jgi:protein SCO1
MPTKPSRGATWSIAALSTVGCALAAGAVIWKLTAGLKLFTSESWRRSAVEAVPRPVPAVELQNDAGELVRLDQLCGRRVVVVDFVYTQCPTVCKALGVSSSQLARRFTSTPGLEDAVVVSVSFDPQRDTPERLRAFKRSMEPVPTAWRLARPVSADGQKQLLSAFGVVVIPDGMGGYDHNAAFHVVDRQCRLVRVLDADGLDGVEATVRRLVSPPFTELPGT